MQYQEYLVKKVFLSLIVVLTSIILISCDTEQSLVDFETSNVTDISIQDNSEKAQDELSSELENADNALLDKFLNVNEASYDIKKERYDLTELFWLEYPQLENMGNSEIQDKVNSIIKDLVWNILPNFEDPYWQEEVFFSVYGSDEVDISYPYYNVEYEIKFSNEKFLSIAFISDYYTGGYTSSSFHPECNALNINLETGEVIELADVFCISEEFSNIVIKKDYVVKPSKKQVDESGKSDDDIFHAYNIVDENKEFFCAYFTEDKLGIVIDSVPLYGYYYIFEVPYSDLEEFKVIISVSAE